MAASSYEARRGELEHYFDRTAFKAWERLTSNVQVSGIRATVRRGRESMRNCLLSWLPDDLDGCRVLDAGCGTGALALAVAQRGATVVAVDISPKLISVAQRRSETEEHRGSIDFVVGDMADASFGDFDYAVAMDSLIHYNAVDIERVVSGLAERVEKSVLFTFAPWTMSLALMHNVGKLFPRSDRAPAIKPVKPDHLQARLSSNGSLQNWRAGRGERIGAGFYISQAQELSRRC